MMSHGVTERCIGRSDSTDVAEHPLSHERLRGILERRDLRWQLLTLNHQRAGSANDRCVPTVGMIRVRDCGSSGYPTDVRK